MKPDYQPDGLPEYPLRYEHHLLWSEEREVEQVLHQMDIEECVDTSADIKSAGTPPNDEDCSAGNLVFESAAYDLNPAGFNIGSVRLLSSTITDGNQRPVYVLVLGEWDAEWSWFAPFSNYSSPATDWELMTKLDPPPLQVLEVWNARSCPNDLLQRSWFVTQVDPAIVESAKALYRRMLGNGKESLGDLVEKVGTKIFDSNDPRLEYIKSETQLLDYLTALAIQHDEAESEDEPVNVIPFVVSIPQEEASMSLAAAGDTSDRKLAFHSWKVEGTEVLLHLVELLGVPNGFTLRVEGDSSGMLEGAIVFDEEASKLGLIEEGCAGSKDVPLRFPTNSLRIELSDGQSVRLVPTNN